MILLLLACSASPDSSSTKGADSGTDSGSTAGTAEAGHTRVAMTTSLGDLEFDLNGTDAPISTTNFLAYVDAGFFDGADGKGATTFHRVVADFVIQGGGYTPDGTAKSTMDAIKLEAGLSNLRGTLAMARTNRPDTATSQFYVNLVDNTLLEGTGNEDGYAVFGTVIAGMDVVDQIAAVAVDASDKPLEDVVITRCKRE